MNDPAKNTALDDLDALVSNLDTQLGATGSSSASVSKRRDAIDAILASSPRATKAKALRDHEIVRRFRKEFADGLIRADTARQFLGLIRLAVDAVMK